jgi:hypothetical protein
MHARSWLRCRRTRVLVVDEGVLDPPVGGAASSTSGGDPPFPLDGASANGAAILA